MPEVSTKDAGGRGLGWLGVGVGLAEVVAPGVIARAVGLGGDTWERTALRIVGLRGLVLRGRALKRQPPSIRLWSRIAGGVVDLALVGLAFQMDSRNLTKRGNKRRVPLALGAVAGMTVLDVIAGVRAKRSRARQTAMTPISVTSAVTIARSAAEIYAFWRQPYNWRRFIFGLDGVRSGSDGNVQLQMKTPAGKTLDWRIQTIEERPYESVTWKATTQASLPLYTTTVQFVPAPGGRGTEVRMELRFESSGGGEILTRLLRMWTKVRLQNDLRRLKQILETGDVVKSDASVHRGPHPARPAMPSEALPIFAAGRKARGGRS